MQLIGEAEERYLPTKDKAIKIIVSQALEQLLNKKEITSTEYKSALDILSRYKLLR